MATVKNKEIIVKGVEVTLSQEEIFILCRILYTIEWDSLPEDAQELAMGLYSELHGKLSSTQAYAEAYENARLA